MATPEDILMLKQLCEQNVVSQNLLDAPLKTFCKELLEGKRVSLGEVLLRLGVISSQELQTLKENNQQILQQIAPHTFSSVVVNVKADDCENLTKMGNSDLGSTYKASHKDVEYCVLKHIEGIIARNRKFLKRFFVQIEKLSKLAHPNIASIYNVSHPKLQIIREYVPGKNLLEYVDENEISILEACNIILNAAKGLNFASQNGILHKNLKPKNIIISDDNVVKLVDFSLPPTIANYLSPEQCQKQKSDMRSDIYSLGLIFYFLITHEPAIKTEDTQETMKQIISSSFFDEASNDIPEEIGIIIGKMLAKNPEDRYSEYHDLINDLDVYSQDAKINIEPGSDEDELMHTAEIALGIAEKEFLSKELPNEPITVEFEEVEAVEALEVEGTEAETEAEEESSVSEETDNTYEPMNAVEVEEDRLPEDADFEVEFSDNNVDLKSSTEIKISRRPIPQLTPQQIKEEVTRKIFQLEEESDEEIDHSQYVGEESTLFNKKHKLKPYFLRNKEETKEKE